MKDIYSEYGINKLKQGIRKIRRNWGLGIGPNPQSPIPNPQSPLFPSEK